MCVRCTASDSEGRNVPEQVAHFLSGPLVSKAGDLRLPPGLGKSGKGRPGKLDALAQGRNTSPKLTSWGSKALPWARV